MTTKNRIRQLEKAMPKQDKKITVMWDDLDGNGATIEGTHYTRQEADRIAAALPESVLVLHVKYDGMKSE